MRINWINFDSENIEWSGKNLATIRKPDRESWIGSLYSNNVEQRSWKWYLLPNVAGLARWCIFLYGHEWAKCALFLILFFWVDNFCASFPWRFRSVILFIFRFIFPLCCCSLVCISLNLVKSHCATVKMSLPLQLQSQWADTVSFSVPQILRKIRSFYNISLFSRL